MPRMRNSEWNKKEKIRQQIKIIDVFLKILEANEESERKIEAERDDS